MRIYSYDERFGFLYTKYSPFVAKYEWIEFKKRPPKNWGYTFYVLWTDKLDPSRWDETLLELHEMGIRDFSELIEFEEEPSENEYGLDRKEYHNLLDFDPYLLASIEWEDYIIGQIGKRKNAKPLGLVDPDWEEEEEEERPEGSWDELCQEIYRCWKEEEEEEREGLPSSFGELFWKMHWY
jgi:hypothetical protein